MIWKTHTHTHTKLTPEIIETLKKEGKNTIRIERQTVPLSKPLNKINNEYYNRITIEEEWGELKSEKKVWGHTVYELSPGILWRILQDGKLFKYVNPNAEIDKNDCQFVSMDILADFQRIFGEEEEKIKIIKRGFNNWKKIKDFAINDVIRPGDWGGWKSIFDIIKKDRMLSQAGRPVSPQAFKFLQDTIAGEVKVIYEPGEHDLAEFDGVKDLATANIEVDIDLEQEKKETESNPSTSKGENLGSGSKSVSSPRTIILIGGVRSGKSALANVLAGQELFKESLKSSSIGNREAREGEFVRETEQGEKITYRLVEIPDFFEAMVDEESKKQVENKLQEELAKGDINQVFLLSRNKFTEIVPYYDYLMSNGMPIEYLTIIRTEYPNFENEAKVNEEKEILQNEDEKSKKIFSSVSLICVDNPPLSSGCLAEINKEVRQISQQKLFAHLANKNEFSPPIILEQPLISLVEKAEKLESEGLLYRPALLEKLMTAIQKNSKLATAEPGLASRVKKLNQKLVELTHTKDLSDAFPYNEEERNKWTNFLNQLKEATETAWIKEEKNFVSCLEHLAENGYQPDDYLCFNQIVDRGKNSESSNSGRSIENQVKVVYKTENGGEFDALVWTKRQANYYSCQCQNVVKEIENKIREVGPGEYPQWPKKINEIIGVPQPQQEGMTTEQQIEEFIFMAADDEQARERTDRIHKIAVNERAIYRSINGKWQDNLTQVSKKSPILF